MYRTAAFGFLIHDLPVNIAGCYPIHASEREFIQENGLEAFWRGVEWDPFEVTRPPVG